MSKKLSRQRRLEHQILKLNGRISQWEQQLEKLSQLRLFLFMGGFVLSSGLFLWQGAGWWFGSIVPLFAPFGITVLRYNQLARAKARWQLWQKIKQQQLARMQLNWAELETPTVNGDYRNHPYAFDLDLVGFRSLHHLLDTAVTAEGSRRLQAWLLAREPALAVIGQRQALVGELIGKALFRDKLILHAQEATQAEGKFLGHGLLAWLEKREEAEQLRPYLIILMGLVGRYGRAAVFTNAAPLFQLLGGQLASLPAHLFASKRPAHPNPISRGHIFGRSFRHAASRFSFSGKRPFGPQSQFDSTMPPLFR